MKRFKSQVKTQVLYSKSKSGSRVNFCPKLCKYHWYQVPLMYGPNNSITTRVHASAALLFIYLFFQDLKRSKVDWSPHQDLSSYCCDSSLMQRSVSCPLSAALTPRSRHSWDVNLLCSLSPAATLAGYQPAVKSMFWKSGIYRPLVALENNVTLQPCLTSCSSTLTATLAERQPSLGVPSFCLNHTTCLLCKWIHVAKMTLSNMACARIGSSAHPQYPARCF